MAQTTKARKTTETKKPSKAKTVKTVKTTETAAKTAAPKTSKSKTASATAAKTATKAAAKSPAKSNAAKSGTATSAASKAKTTASKPAAGTSAATAGKKTTSATRRAASATTSGRGAATATAPATPTTAAGNAKRKRAVAASVAPSASAKISAPVDGVKASLMKAISGEGSSKKPVAPREASAASKKPISQRHGFKTAEYVVYPAHGVGQIVAIEEQEIAGIALELFVITFDKEKLTLRVPTGKLESVGMRKLSDEAAVKKAMHILKGRARVKRTMWSRRAQEYVAKITSGDLVAIAEVVRDLYRSDAQPEQSYSERQLYEDALDRMARELAAVEKLDERTAVQRIVEVLAKSAKGRRQAEEDAAAEAEAEAEAEKDSAAA